MNNRKQLVEYAVLEFKQWKLFMAKTEKGLCYTGAPGQPHEECKAWIQKRFPLAELKESKKSLQPYINEFQDYFKRNSQTFSLPLDVKGTPFQEQVWEAVKKVTYGKTCSYADIAALIQKPAAVRAVGGAIGANPVLIALPCHRVIGKNGLITGYRGGLKLKKWLIELEKPSGNKGIDF